MAVQNPYLTTDGDINQAKRKRAGESMAIDAVPKQTSFDVTNTPAGSVPGNPARAAQMQAQYNQPVSGPRGVVTSAGAPSAPKVPGIADGLAGGADMAQPDAVYVEPGSRWGSFAYAGGAVEIGLDDGTTFTRLGSFWIRGGFFQPKSDGTSWDNPALPPSNLEIFSLDGDGIVRVLLNADVPVPLF